MRRPGVVPFDPLSSSGASFGEGAKGMQLDGLFLETKEGALDETILLGSIGRDELLAQAVIAASGAENAGSGRCVHCRGCAYGHAPESEWLARSTGILSVRDETARRDQWKCEQTARKRKPLGPASSNPPAPWVFRARSTVRQMKTRGNPS